MSQICRLWLLAPLLLLAACASTGAPDGPPQADFKEAAQINSQLGMDYLRQGNVDAAEDKLKRALTQDPDQINAHVVLAIIYARKHHDELAEEHFERALDIDSDNPDALNNYGTFLCSRHRGNDGEKYFLRALESADFKQPELAWTNAAVCLRDSDPEKAERYLREALKISPAFPDALSQFALICYRKGDYLRARGFLQRFEAAAAPTAQTLWLRARTEAALGDAAAAANYEQQLKHQFPEADVSGLSASTP